ncbi:SMI1/KNR4 family protein [Corallococcus praedator]|uniref:SMI1/KNR4 family protein n=2 Tax=Myxococcaceae TaxID=31 RepID=A0ABX9QA15_9BACT|nr:SMI1/KNR4 family protein [Corallococcus sp. CA047B]RKH31977.1 SMI1/KNR4 family protein [Corallococcus sp. CA031C]RKH96441.1 SMI1/KNR4 family protein [Corallococcus praedator]
MAQLVRTTEGGPPLSEDDLRSFEQRCGFKLPHTLREFLLATNGGRPERDLFKIHGLKGNPLGRIHLFFGLKDPVESCNLDWNLEVFQERIPHGLLPIATTEGADKICLSVAGADAGRVFYWDAHAPVGENNLHPLADNLGAFISALRSDALSPVILKS